MTAERDPDDPPCRFVINEGDGYGFRCDCGYRNLGFRFVTRKAAEDERDYHLGKKERPPEKREPFVGMGDGNTKSVTVRMGPFKVELR